MDNFPEEIKDKIVSSLSKYDLENLSRARCALSQAATRLKFRRLELNFNTIMSRPGETYTSICAGAEYIREIEGQCAERRPCLSDLQMRDYLYPLWDMQQKFIVKAPGCEALALSNVLEHLLVWKVMEGLDEGNITLTEWHDACVGHNVIEWLGPVLAEFPDVVAPVKKLTAHFLPNNNDEVALLRLGSPIFS